MVKIEGALIAETLLVIFGLPNGSVNPSAEPQDEKAVTKTK
jgi:hypothetical protein